MVWGVWDIRNLHLIFFFLFLRREIKFAAFSQNFVMCLFVLFVYLLYMFASNRPHFSGSVSQFYFTYLRREGARILYTGYG